MRQGPDMSLVATNSEEKAINGSQKEAYAHIRSVLIVGAGPAGLMLAYVHPIWPIFPFLFPLSLQKDFPFHVMRFILHYYGPFSNHYKHTNIYKVKLGPLWNRCSDHR